MRYQKYLLFTLIAAIAFAGCNGSKDKAGRPPSRPRVTLATAKNVWCSLSHIAKAKGYFEREGLDVDLQNLQGGRYCLDAVISNSAEFGNIVEVNVAYIGYTGNTNLAVIANIVSSQDSAIVIRKSSGIEKPEDLRGKKLALSPAMTSDIFAHRFLQKHGIKPDEIQIVKVQPLAIQATIVGKGADAASTWEPFVHNIAKALGDDCIILKDPDIYTGYETIAVRKDWAKKNPNVVKAFLRAMKAAEQFVKDYPEEAKTIVAEAISLDREVVDATWPEFDISLKLDEMKMTDEVTAIGKWIRETQDDYKGKDLPDYRQYFDSSYLKSTQSN